MKRKNSELDDIKKKCNEVSGNFDQQTSTLRAKQAELTDLQARYLQMSDSQAQQVTTIQNRNIEIANLKGKYEQQTVTMKEMEQKMNGLTNEHAQKIKDKEMELSKLQEKLKHQQA